ncbi:hypothetical protein SOVF_054160 [Spinacia oleracea]|nr:hypothetical protein SOVF_054160 [Spinacia oleracea]
MAYKMKKKYDKYWDNVDNINLMLYIAAVLDPRRKIFYVKWAIDDQYDLDKASKLYDMVSDALTSLYEHYSSSQTENVVFRLFGRVPMPKSAAQAHFLSTRRVLIPGIFFPMWYLGERVAIKHSSDDQLVPFDPPESMMLDASAACWFYRRALHQSGADSLCLHWSHFVDREANYEAFLDRLAPSAEEDDSDDVPYADKVLRYTDDDWRQVEAPVPEAPSSHRVATKAIPELFLAPSRGMVRSWMVVIDFLKGNCVKLTKKLVGRGHAERKEDHRESEDRETQRADEHTEQTELNLDLGLNTAAMGDSWRRSDVGGRRDVASSRAQV